MKGMNAMNEVYEFLKKCNTYYLATMDGDQPRVRPFGTVNLFEDKLYIQTGKQRVYQNSFRRIQRQRFAPLMERNG